MSELSGEMRNRYELAESDDCDRFQRLRLYQEQVRLGRERFARIKERESTGVAT